MLNQATKDNEIDSLRLFADDNDISVKSSTTSSAPPLVGRMNFISRRRRFYIDDILASDFGHRCLEEHRSVGSELNTTPQTVVDTAAVSPIDHAKIADRTISLSIGTAPESDQSISQSPSSSVTSLQRIHDNGISTDSTISSSSCSGVDRRTTLKNGVKVEPCRSTNTDVTASNDATGTICNVTSSTSLVPGRNVGYKANDINHFTLPAWVYCTRYSDRPSAGNI